MDDFGRTNIVLKPVCKLCGKPLRTSYKCDVSPIDDFKEDITGAYKTQVYLAIYPCDSCYSKAKEPIEHLKAALRGLG